MQTARRITLMAVAAGLATVALGFGAMSAGAQSVPVNPAPTPPVVNPVVPPVAPPASPIQPPSAPVNPSGGQLGVNGAPGALPNSGTGPSQSRGNSTVFFILAGSGLALAAAGVATRRRAHQR